METVHHQGTVTAVNPGRVNVKIISFSACHHCDARHGCGLMDCQDKNIEVITADAENFHTGEKVELNMPASSGLQAVFYGYGLPLILMLAAVIIVSAADGSELWAGISAIIILIPYYFWLFLNRKYFKKHFNFTISKLDN